MQEMKPCQYCGSDNLDMAELHDPMRTPVKQKYVQCEECGACGPLADDENEAILKWNSRIEEASDMPQERPTIISADKYDNLGCPIQGPDKPCNGMFCMMWVSVGEDKGRCGLVNTMYINSTICGE